MSWTAFYAPLKPPGHPAPSGDRAMARGLMQALSPIVPAPLHLASTLRTREGVGDAAAQERIVALAAAEIARLCAGPPPERWITYHNYYKAPDLIGAAVARHFDIPYAIIEPSRARKRLSGPWAGFARAAEAASDAAQVLFAMTAHDRATLERDRAPGQRIETLRPFLPCESIGPLARRQPRDHPRLLAVAMMRPGVKIASYAALAEAIDHIEGPERAAIGPTLTIVGDGAARAEVERLFGARASFSGRLEPDAVRRQYQEHDILAWPGIGEAYGMVYLEAQAEGMAVLAEDHPGVRDVVREGGLLVKPGRMGPALNALCHDMDRARALGRAGHAQVARDHLLPAARAALERGLQG